MKPRTVKTNKDFKQEGVGTGKNIGNKTQERGEEQPKKGTQLEMTEETKRDGKSTEGGRRNTWEGTGSTLSHHHVRTSEMI